MPSPLKAPLVAAINIALPSPPWMLPHGADRPSFHPSKTPQSDWIKKPP